MQSHSKPIFKPIINCVLELDAVTYYPEKPEEISDALKLALQNPGISQLILDFSKITFRPHKNKKKKVHENDQATLQTRLIEAISDSLVKKTACGISELHLLNWEIYPNTIFNAKAVKEHKNKILSELASKLRENENNIQVISFTGATISDDILSGFLKNLFDEKTNQTESKITHINLDPIVIQSTSSQHEITKKNGSNHFAGRVKDQPAENEENNAPPTRDASAPVRSDSRNHPANNNHHAYQNFIKNIQVMRARTMIEEKIIPLKKLQEKREEPVAKKNKIQSKSRSLAASNTPSFWKHVSVADIFLMSTGAASALVFSGSFTASLVGLALTTLSLGLVVGAPVALGLLIGIGVGLYSAYQDYKREAATYEVRRRPAKPQLSAVIDMNAPEADSEDETIAINIPPQSSPPEIDFSSLSPSDSDEMSYEEAEIMDEPDTPPVLIPKKRHSI